MRHLVRIGNSKAILEGVILSAARLGGSRAFDQFANRMEDAMANKQTFTPEEWSSILSSPMLAGMAVSLADPSGLWGMMKEGASGVRVLLDAKNDAATNQLVTAMVADFESSEGRSTARDALSTRLSGKSPTELKRQVLDGLAQAAKLVDDKAPDEAAAFKQLLKTVAEQVSEAAKEGGFLGFGGIRVSDAEKASVADVAKVLRI
jgi:hypothetical protein